MRTEVDVLVLGAGVGGLGSAVWLKKNRDDNAYVDMPENENSFMVVDGNDSLPLNLHNGVHYLHTIPSLPFDSGLKKITLTDGVLRDGKICQESDLMCALQYSEKVREIQHPSSIMNIGKDTCAYMPQTNSLNELCQQMYDFAGVENFEFGYWLKGVDLQDKIARFSNKQGEEHFVKYNKLISTVPLDKIRDMFEDDSMNELKDIKLECTPVYISNLKVDRIVPNWMINIYVPDLLSPVYRASLLNGVFSVESIRELTQIEIERLPTLFPMFHVNIDGAQKYTWATGKVISISQDERAKLVEMLAERDIYSIGRFGLWNRKLLVDSTIEQAKMVVEHINGKDWTEVKDVLIK